MAFCLQLIVTVRKIIANIFFRKLTEIRGKMREHYINKNLYFNDKQFSLLFVFKQILCSEYSYFGFSIKP